MCKWFYIRRRDLERAWENLTVDMNKFQDFYFFKWPAETLSKLIKDLLFFISKTTIHLITTMHLIFYLISANIL